MPQPSGPISARLLPAACSSSTAYKDEYEVARMLVDPAFIEDVKSQVPAGENLTYKLHPPILRVMGRKKKTRSRTQVACCTEGSGQG